MQGFEGEVPLELARELSRNAAAMRCFAGLPYPEQKHFVEGAKAARTAGEMRTYVAALGGTIR